MRKILIVAGMTIFLAGCASGPSNYQLYAETQKAIAQAQAQAEIARYLALTEIAKTGDPSARVAAVMSLQMGAPTRNNAQQIAPPKSPSESLINWASILVPSAVQLFGIQQSTQLGLRHSDNATRLAIDTNKSFVDMTKEINDPVIVNPVVVQSGAE